MWRVGSFSAGEEKQISLESGSCVFAEERQGVVSPELRELIRQRLDGSQRVAQSKRAQQEFINIMAAMKAETDKLRVPFIIVVFPHRVVADSELRVRLKLEAKQMIPLDALHSLIYKALPNTPIIDAMDAVRGHSEMYRSGDTHLSDLGNKISGEYVGQKLAGVLRTMGSGAR
jgi:hypothetical protein